MEDKSTKLLPVVVGKSALRSRSRTLRNYLKTHIYLEWGSDSFWKKLKYFMPDRSIKDAEGQERAMVRQTCHDLLINDTELLLST
jgi:hypothetical protein